MGNEHEICTVLLFEVLTDQCLFLRLQIVRASDLSVILLSDQALRLIKADIRDLFHVRKFDL